MGIRGLERLLHEKHQFRAIDWTAHAGKRWAVDILCLMYRARKARLSILSVVAGLIVRLRRFGVEPVMVFDGRPPAAKAEVLTRRREVRTAVAEEIATITAAPEPTTTAERDRRETRVAELQARAPTVGRNDRDELKQLLYAAGVLFVTAAGEADDLLGWLARRGEVSAVVSTDMDMLARGVPLLVVPGTDDATVLSGVELAGVLGALRLTYRQFVDACMLMGSDYYAGRYWTPTVAVEAARRGVWDISGAAFDVGAGLLRGDGVTWEGLLVESQ
ncbi:hypothetical protein EBZ80_13560, partial [bacterium]|nr:hypothetical protein [bacterium]